MTSLAVALAVVLTQTTAEATSTVAPEPSSTNASSAAAPASSAEPASALSSTPVVTSTTPTAVGDPVVKQTSTVPWYQRVTLTGYARLQAGYTFPLQDEQLVGGNGGFRVAEFRVNLDFRPIEKMTVFTSVELAAPLFNPDDPLNGRRIVELRDAFFQYDVCKGFIVRAGQFRPPYDAEMLTSDGALPFMSRSILANGVLPPEGYGPRQPLAPDRQVGLQVSSLRLGNDTVGVRYAVGVFNGAGPNQLYNDNNGLMPVARVELELLKYVTVGVNASYNVRSDGVRPNRLMTSQVGYGVDVEAHRTFHDVHSVSAMVVFLGRASSFSFSGLPAESATGVLGQARYVHERTGLEAALRFAYLEPSSAQEADQVTELTALVGWRPFRLPFRILGQYTHRGEEGPVAYPNDSVDLMLHAVW